MPCPREKPRANTPNALAGSLPRWANFDCSAQYWRGGKPPDNSMDTAVGQRIMRRVWLVGAGYISGIHAEALRTLPNMRLHGVIDLNRDSAQAFAARYGVKHVAASGTEALSTGEVDAVHILTPPN